MGAGRAEAHPLEVAASRLEAGAAELQTDEAALLLAALGYAPGPAEASVLPNRVALLRLGARVGDVFRLPSPCAPGIVAMGARAGEAGAPGFSGRGRTLAEAFESCMGEAAEYFSLLRQPSDPRVAAGDGQVAARVLVDGAPCRLPATAVLRDPVTGNGGLTGGTGAGPDPEAATRAALLEAVERDAVARWWHGRAPARRVSKAEAAALGVPDVIAVSRRGVERPTWLLDLTPAHGVPVVAALSAAADGGGVVAGFAARARLAAAAEGALLELFQMEVASGLALRRANEVGEAALAPGERVWLARHRHLTTAAFPGLAGADLPAMTRDLAPGAPAADIAARLAAAAHIACAAEITLASIGVPVVRVVVEGFRDIGGFATLERSEKWSVAPI